jgi:anaerobic selenocysteine-containing dehydrogenase
LQTGGWWKNTAGLAAPKAAGALDKPLPPVQAPAAAKPDEFYLVVFPTQLGDGSGANRPWLQETPDPTTTVTWNTWVEIAPETAEKHGFKNDDIIKIKSASGEIEAPVYRYPAIRPDTIAIPFGNGHQALGQFAKDRGANPAVLFDPLNNEVEGAALGDTRVTLTNTGKQKRLARVESREGVYGTE